MRTYGYGYGPVMTPALADTIIKAQVEAILAKNEQLARLFDKYAVAASRFHRQLVSSFMETKTLYLIEICYRI